MYPKIYMPNNCRSLSFLSCNLDRSVIKLKRRNKLNKFIVLLPQFANHKQACRCTSLEWREYKLALTCAYIKQFRNNKLTHSVFCICEF